MLVTTSRSPAHRIIPRHIAMEGNTQISLHLASYCEDHRNKSSDVQGGRYDEHDETPEQNHLCSCTLASSSALAAAAPLRSPVHNRFWISWKASYRSVTYGQLGSSAPAFPRMYQSRSSRWSCRPVIQEATSGLAIGLWTNSKGGRFPSARPKEREHGAYRPFFGTRE